MSNLVLSSLILCLSPNRKRKDEYAGSLQKTNIDTDTSINAFILTNIYVSRSLK